MRQTRLLPEDHVLSASHIPSRLCVVDDRAPRLARFLTSGLFSRFSSSGRGNFWLYENFYGHSSFERFTGYVDRWIVKDTLFKSHRYWMLNTGKFSDTIRSRAILRIERSFFVVDKGAVIFYICAMMT